MSSARRLTLAGFLTCSAFMLVPVGTAGCAAEIVNPSEYAATLGGDGCGPATLGTIYIWDPVFAAGELTVETAMLGLGVAVLAAGLIYGLIQALQRVAKRRRVRPMSRV